MFWPLYQTLLVFAGVCTLVVVLAQRAVVPLSLTAGSLWAILALQARNIRVIGQDTSTSIVVGSQAWQFVALGLAILSLGAAVLWYWGVFPPDDDAASPAAEAVSSDESGNYGATNFDGVNSP